MNNILKIAIVPMILAFVAHGNGLYVEASTKSTLDMIIKNRATSIKKSPDLNEGRKSLVNEMEKYPEQLAKDIGRLSRVIVGKKDLSEDMKADKTAKEKFVLLANTLEGYLKNYINNHPLPSLKRINTTSWRLGYFWTAEIIYALVQNFSAPPWAKARKETLLKDRDPDGSEIWGSPSGSSKLLVSFQLLLPSTGGDLFLVVTDTTEKQLVNLTTGETKPFVMVTRVKFNLNNGTVTYEYSYDVGNGMQKRVWTEATFQLNP
jgi:hypothetical protein